MRAGLGVVNESGVSHRDLESLKAAILRRRRVLAMQLRRKASLALGLDQWTFALTDRRRRVCRIRRVSAQQQPALPVARQRRA